MNWIYWASGIMLTVAALLALVRMVVGPTVLNRALANDVLVAVIVCVLGLEAVITDDTSTLPILITVSLLGFVSTVAISRFVARDVDEVP
ncbi:MULTISPECIES: monovalent cation/H+ antiporter complex subunit F [unclassified Luteococcus]|uniref:monovalent cation/H+ antiporter complex subunit F n=1 Tax=unclassified Luteococcus TaxID=2639923 RepID=UPI00313D545F